jgi:hypothetical protein
MLLNIVTLALAKFVSFATLVKVVTSDEAIMLRFLLILLILVLAACRQQPPANTADLDISLTIAPDNLVGEALAVVTVRDRAGQPIDNARVQVRGDMTHAGMVPVIVETSSSVDGRYELDFNWTMGGDWFVDVTVTLPDDTFARQRFNFRIRS